MSVAPRRIREKARLAAVETVDLEAARPAFDRIAMLARSLAGVGHANVDLVHAMATPTGGEGAQPPVLTTPEAALASHVIAGDEVLWIEDLSQDPRFAASGSVTGPAQRRFYAGAPIRLADGSRVGALSISDHRPRAHDAFLAERLEDLAALAAAECERRRAAGDAARATATLAGALAAAEAANRAKSAFLAHLSLEMRTPLSGVTGVAGVLGRTSLTAAQREMVGVIEASARTLDARLSDVLELSRIEAGEADLVAEPFDLAAALRATAALFEPRVRQKGLTFKVTISPAAHAQVVGDATRFRQILANLLSNAVKFTEQGRVSLTVEAEPLEADVRLQISVVDTGVGFDAETGKRILNGLEEDAGPNRVGGAGLGLAISRSLARAMGGALTASSTPGKGAVFSFEIELPIAACAPIVVQDHPAAPLADAAPPAAPVAEARAPRILLAEDHPTSRKMVALILESFGVDLVCVENGVEALAAAQAAAFDLILMDMQMPVMDGLAAIRAIRAKEGVRGPHTPILSLTANAMPEHAEASLDAGADGHLTKPISAAQLMAAVSATCAAVAPAKARSSAGLGDAA